MKSPQRAVLLVALACLTSAATVQRTQSVAGGTSRNGVNTSFNSIGTRGGFSSQTPAGGTAFMSTSTVNGRPVSFNSFTSGTGANRLNSFNTGTLGNRGGFNSGAYRPVAPVVPIRPIVMPTIPYFGQSNFNRFGTNGYNNGATLGTRFGGNRGSVSSFSASSSTAGTGLNVDGYLNALAANINRNLQASLGRR